MTSGGDVAFRVAWEQQAGAAASTAGDGLPAAAFDTPIPPSVSAIRFILRPEAAPPCCLVVKRGSQPFEDRRILLANVSPGLGSLEVHGFPTQFAPSAGVSATCATRPPGEGSPCSGAQNTLPSFGSEEIPVDVVPGFQNIVNVDVHSLPFLLDLDPEDGGAADSATPTVSFAVVDANHPVDADLGIRIRNEPVTVQADILTSEECRDGDAELPDCSEDGELEVQGLLVTSVSPQVIPEGLAQLRIRASNLASTPRDMESNTTFNVPPGATTTTTTNTIDTTTSSSTTTTIDTTTTTLGFPASFCVKFSVTNAVDLVGISYDVGYGNSDGEFPGSGEDVSCFNLLETNPNSTLASFNDDDQGTLTTAIVSAETFSGPTGLAQCEFRQVAPLDLTNVVIQVTEATAPDLSPANATVVVEETPCPL
ncbi:MAG: hypothetical protein ABR538_01785 [Candidatus Binatia bacterium]